MNKAAEWLCHKYPGGVQLPTTRGRLRSSLWHCCSTKSCVKHPSHSGDWNKLAHVFLCTTLNWKKKKNAHNTSILTHWKSTSQHLYSYKINPPTPTPTPPPTIWWMARGGAALGNPSESMRRSMSERTWLFITVRQRARRLNAALHPGIQVFSGFFFFFPIFKDAVS